VTLTVAIDTATEVATVAVGKNDAVLVEIAIGARRHAAALLPGIEEALRLARGEMEDVSRVLLADGPGSFTGLRIGAATMQGLWRGRPEVTVRGAPSLLAAAWGARHLTAGPVAALYDALRGEVFAAVYRFEQGEIQTLVAPTLTTVLRLAASGVRAGIAVGDGAAAHPVAVRDWTGADPAPPPLGGPRASALLALDLVNGALTTIDDPATFEPEYGRPAEAQARWERAHGRPLPDSRRAPR
jgi:tRNA threonylcarbamoyl adenosine modification protein YeaZ